MVRGRALCSNEKLAWVVALISVYLLNVQKIRSVPPSTPSRKTLGYKLLEIKGILCVVSISYVTGYVAKVPWETADG